MNSHTTEHKKAVGIVMTYNSSALLEDILNRIPKEPLDAIFIVDDDSKDVEETKSIALRLGVPFFTHEHMGYGGNIRYGLTKALEMGAEYMVEIHGDGQFDPSVIPAALKKMEEGRYDFLLGSRFMTGLLQPLRDGMSLARYLANIGLSTIDRAVLGVRVSEFHTGFRVYSRNLTEKLPLQNTSLDYLYGFEVIAQAAFFKLKIGEIPVRADYHKEHTSISIWKSTVYSFKTMYVLSLFLLAKMGCKIRLFSR